MTKQIKYYVKGCGPHGGATYFVVSETTIPKNALLRGSSLSKYFREIAAKKLDLNPIHVNISTYSISPFDQETCSPWQRGARKTPWRSYTIPDRGALCPLDSWSDYMRRKRNRV